MKPKEKAKDLIERMYQVHSSSASDITWYFAKQCALIAVEEILTRMIGSRAYSFNEKLFWSEVKSELQSL